MKNWLRERDKKILSPYYGLIKDSIDELIARSDSKPVLLEIGCGRGSEELVKMYEKCEKIIGVDPDKLALQDNKNVDHKINAEMERADLPKDSVDIIVSSWAFEHINNPIETVRAIRRILKRGGYLIFITPNKNSLPGVLNRCTPHFLQAFLCKILYKRYEKDIYPTFYRFNSIKDIRKYLRGFKEKDLIMHDDVKFFGSLWLFRPLAILWNYIIMSGFMKNVRAIIISRYIKE